MDQLVIGTKSSYNDFDANVKERKIIKPKKKSIKKTVPFSNVTYDFSKINGEIYWEEGSLEYVLEITADTPEELSVKKIRLLSWLMNVTGEILRDPFIEDYHFIATYDDIDDDDSEIEKSTIKVTFTVYPYMIADEETVETFDLTANTELQVTISNDSSHRITPTFISDSGFTVKIGDSSFSFPAGTVTSDNVKLEAGINEIKLKANANCTVNISFRKEVFLC